MSEKKLIKQGAESRIYIIDHLGQNIIQKERFPKKYRIEQLDKMITKQRMKAELKALSKCHNANIKVPIVYNSDFKTHSIFMEYFPNAITVKDAFNKFNIDNDKIGIERLGNILGHTIGKLHNNGIIHGDLTTSNFLIENYKYSENPNTISELITIDFGLSRFFDSSQNVFISSILEDKAVDLYVLERAFISTHSDLTDIMENVILKAYISEVDNNFGNIKKSNPNLLVDNILQTQLNTNLNDNESDISDDEIIINDKLNKSINYNTNKTASSFIFKKLAEVRLRGRKRTMVG